MQNKLLLFERNCLENNSVDNFVENVMVQNYLVECNNNVQQVQSMIKEVLLILNYSYFEQDIDDKKITNKLPILFISKFL